MWVSERAGVHLMGYKAENDHCVHENNQHDFFFRSLRPLYLNIYIYIVPDWFPCIQGWMSINPNYIRIANTLTANRLLYLYFFCRLRSISNKCLFKILAEMNLIFKFKVFKILFISKKYFFYTRYAFLIYLYLIFHICCIFVDIRSISTLNLIIYQFSSIHSEAS